MSPLVYPRIYFSSNTAAKTNSELNSYELCASFPSSCLIRRPVIISCHHVCVLCHRLVLFVVVHHLLGVHEFWMISHVFCLDFLSLEQSRQTRRECSYFICIGVQIVFGKKPRLWRYFLLTGLQCDDKMNCKFIDLTDLFFPLPCWTMTKF